MECDTRPCFLEWKRSQNLQGPNGFHSCWEESKRLTLQTRGNNDKNRHKRVDKETTFGWSFGKNFCHDKAHKAVDSCIKSETNTTFSQSPQGQVKNKQLRVRTNNWFFHTREVFTKIVQNVNRNASTPLKDTWNE